MSACYESGEAEMQHSAKGSQKLQPGVKAVDVATRLSSNTLSRMDGWGRPFSARSPELCLHKHPTSVNSDMNSASKRKIS